MTDNYIVFTVFISALPLSTDNYIVVTVFIAALPLS